MMLLNNIILFLNSYIVSGKTQEYYIPKVTTLENHNLA